MPSVYDPDNFAGRVNYAATVIMRKGASSRSFDTCFEMYDGAAVAAALVRRAERNARLAENLPRYLCGTTAQEVAERYAGRNLSEVARDLRAKAEQERLAREARWAAEDAAKAA